MPKYRDSIQLDPLPDVWLVNPDGRLVAVKAKAEEVTIRQKGGTKTVIEYLGHPAFEKAHKGIGRWRIATDEEAAKATKEAEEKAAKDRAAMEEREAARDEAVTMIAAAKELKKGKKKRKKAESE